MSSLQQRKDDDGDDGGEEGIKRERERERKDRKFAIQLLHKTRALSPNLVERKLRKRTGD